MHNQCKRPMRIKYVLLFLKSSYIVGLCGDLMSFNWISCVKLIYTNIASPLNYHSFLIILHFFNIYIFHLETSSLRCTTCLILHSATTYYIIRLKSSTTFNGIPSSLKYCKTLKLNNLNNKKHNRVVGAVVQNAVWCRIQLRKPIYRYNEVWV
jgi:hypothetical protein